MGLDSLAQTMHTLVQVRCPKCRQRHFDAYLTGDSFAVVQCRCKTKFRIDPKETFIITTAASVSRTFDGRRYDSFGLLTQ
jgi:hypothetical protein